MPKTPTRSRIVLSKNSGAKNHSKILDAQKLTRLRLAAGLLVWYNERMSEMTILPPNSNSPTVARPPIKRILAHMIKKAGRGELFVEAMGKKMRYDAYLSIMLWDAITTGMMYFADGTQMRIEDFKDWLDLTKFVAQHIDGPMVHDVNFNNINIYKVYQGIDESKV